MTVRDILSAIGRRWYVQLAVLLCACALAMTFERDGGSFSTSTAVSFTLPARTTLDPESGASNESVIAFAGVVATIFNQGRPTLQYSEPGAPIYGAGVRQGVFVGLRNAGNQWNSYYPSATIDVQIVGRTFEWVQQMQQNVLADIDKIASAQQTLQPPTDRIVATVDPLTTSIGHVAPTRTAQLAAFGALFLASLLTGGWCAVTLDRALLQRRARHALSGVPPIRQHSAKGRIA